MEYRPTHLADRFVVPLVQVDLLREPLDMTYAAFITAELQSGQYDDCLAALIVHMDSRGMYNNVKALTYSISRKVYFTKRLR